RPRGLHAHGRVHQVLPVVRHHVPGGGESHRQVHHRVGRPRRRGRTVPDPRPSVHPVDPVRHHVAPLHSVGQHGGTPGSRVVEHPVGTGVVGHHVDVAGPHPVVVTA